MYARDTTVTVERSRMEIELILKRYGAAAFAYMYDVGKAMIAFECRGRRVRFVLKMPDPDAKEFSNKFRKSNGRQVIVRKLTDQQRENAVQKEIQRRWRALCLCIKGKLESVESQIETFDHAFLANIVLPDGKTVGEWADHQVAIAYERNTMPALLLEHDDKKTD